MVELAEIFRRYGPAYREKFANRLLPSQRLTMQAVERCRTEALGGHIYFCDDCEASQYSYHSCKNRHCPKCQNDTAEQWLEKQQAFLLPVPYFMVTFTLPAALRALALHYQQRVYNLLFRTSAAALQQLAQDPRFIGGQIGMMGVLHTWGRNLAYHPHVHYLVPGGGLSPDGQSWLTSHHNILVHVKPLSSLFRAKFRDALKKANLFDLVPAETWSQPWVVHSKPVGTGHNALKYLAPYVFRVAISNNRILKVENDQVTFRYKDTATSKTKFCTLAAEEFIRRFLQHVLPKGFVKVRYYGLFSPTKREQLDQIRLGLLIQAVASPTTIETGPPEKSPQPSGSLSCPQCGRPMHAPLGETAAYLVSSAMSLIPITAFLDPWLDWSRACDAATLTSCCRQPEICFAVKAIKSLSVRPREPLGPSRPFNCALMQDYYGYRDCWPAKVPLFEGGCQA